VIKVKTIAKPLPERFGWVSLGKAVGVQLGVTGHHGPDQVIIGRKLAERSGDARQQRHQQHDQQTAPVGQVHVSPPQQRQRLLL
jgi:hypothetical protein